MVTDERSFRRAQRDIRQVGLKKARQVTRADTVRIRSKQRAKKRPSTFRQIVTGLIQVARGEATFPLPGVGMAGRGMQVQSIGRQTLARVPLPAKIVASAAAGTGVAAAVEFTTGRSPARILHDVARAPFTGQRREPMARAGPLQVGGVLPPAHQVVRTWQTFPGGPIFARMADGHIVVQKKDGTLKHFRPYRPVVIPRKWNARSMSRVATALKRQRKTATKILQITGGVPKRTVRVGAGGRSDHAMRGRDV